MRSAGLLERIAHLAGQARRRPFVIGGIALAVVAAVIVPPSLRDGRMGPPARIFKAQGCSEAPAIDVAPSTSGKAWTSLVVPATEPCATLGATDANRAGVALTTSFVLTSSEAITAASVQERLTVQPATPFDVKQVTSTRLQITPRSKLLPGIVYRVALLDPTGTRPVTRWAFQTRSPLRVVQTLPRDESTDIPLNIGIELTFSHDGVEGAEDRFSISPKTAGRFEVHKRVFVFVPDELRPRTLYTVTLKPGVRVAGSDESMRQPFTFRFETGSSERSGETPGEPAIQFGRATWESATAEPPVVSLFVTSEKKPPSTLPFTVYRFKDVRSFLSSLD
ncbi:MAG: Ig-like domain-containing protein, partial [Actinomycetota bacterium]